MSLFDNPSLHDFPDRAFHLRRISQMVKRTWEQEMLLRGRAEGEARARREDLRLLSSGAGRCQGR